MLNQHFFMVFLEGQGAPTYQHDNLLGAEQEAKRLSKKYGKKAFVLCILKSFEVLEFQENDCRPDPDWLPF